MSFRAYAHLEDRRTCVRPTYCTRLRPGTVKALEFTGRNKGSRDEKREAETIPSHHAVREGGFCPRETHDVRVFRIRQPQVDQVLMDAGRATGVTATVTPRGGGKVTPFPEHGRAYPGLADGVNLATPTTPSRKTRWFGSSRVDLLVFCHPGASNVCLVGENPTCSLPEL